MLTVLTYHRVDRPDADPRLDPALVSATPLEFERHAAWLALNATPLSLGELLEVRRRRAKLPRRAVLVTFDDAYRDFATHAWPALRRHGVPATLFVPTSYPGARRGFWWDRLHAALRGMPEARRALRDWAGGQPHDRAMAAVEEICAREGEPPAESPVLDWDELRALAADGVELAPHSRTHPRLDRVSLERAREEIRGSREDLERELGRPCVPAFAFPGGGHEPRLGRVLAEESLELGFTTQRGPTGPSRIDWLALRRTNVGRRTTLPVLRAQLLPLPAPVHRVAAGVLR